jgi:signal transduction histidine kinase
VGEVSRAVDEDVLSASAHDVRSIGARALEVARSAEQSPRTGRETVYVADIETDEGPGFPRARLGTVPTPSWQGGRRLALAIVARLVLRQGGTIGLENGGARGAVVTVELPAQP